MLLALAAVLLLLLLGNGVDVVLNGGCPVATSWFIVGWAGLSGVSPGKGAKGFIDPVGCATREFFCVGEDDGNDSEGGGDRGFENGVVLLVDEDSIPNGEGGVVVENDSEFCLCCGCCCCC